MKRVILISVVISCLGAHELAGQTRNGAFTPARGTAERQGLINDFRAAYYQPHKGKLRFKVIYLKVHGSWAWLYAEPISNAVDTFGETYGSLLHRTMGKWKIMDLPEFVDDPGDPEKLKYPTAADIKEIRRLYPSIPTDIFPSAETHNQNSRPNKRMERTRP